MSELRKVPPLRVWCFTAVILLVVLVALSLQKRALGFTATPVPVLYDAMNLRRLERGSGDATHIVVLGSSKTLFATSYDTVFENRLNREGRHFTFNRLTWLDARPVDIEPALSVLAKHPPSILLFEADLLLLNRDARFPLRDDLRPLEMRLHAIIAPHAAATAADSDNFEQNRGRDKFPSTQECVSRQLPETRLMYASRAQTRRLSTPSQQEQYLRWLRAMHAHGTRIVLLELPRAPWAEAVFPSRLRAAGESLLQRIAAQESFSIWESGPFAEDAYCDEGHMNEAGRAAFGDWLQQRLSDAPELP